MSILHIERKKRQNHTSTARISAWLDAPPRHSLGTVTTLEAVANTGLPIDEARWALLSLATQRKARIDSDEFGNLTFSFLASPPGSAWQGARSKFALISKKLSQWLSLSTLNLFGPPFLLWCCAHAIMVPFNIPSAYIAAPIGLPFMLFYGVGACMSAIAIVMEILAIAGVAMIVAGVGLIGMTVADGEWADLIWVLPLSLTLFIGLGFAISAYGWTFCANIFNEGAGKEVWRFARELMFGPDRRPDLWEDERRLVNTITSLGGVLSAWDIVRTFGVEPAIADSQIARIIVDYGGDIEVTDDGEVLFIFSALGAFKSESVSTSHSTSSISETTSGHDKTNPCGLIPKKPYPPRLLPKSGRLFLTGLVLIPWLGLFMSDQLLVFPGLEALELTFSSRFRFSPNDADLPLFIVQGVGGWPYALLVALIALRTPSYLWRRRLWKQQLRIHELATSLLPRTQPEAEELRQEILQATPEELIARFGGDLLATDGVGLQLYFDDAERHDLAAKRRRRSPHPSSTTL